ncbi:hypothetical protein [Kitasatospora sp. NBC_01302]|uniref:hypothetical protein n=1 Tax=Kitasatospora sp. NBC_01302 TaxID=2903575 RepID=UPI002E12EE4C|nr:hypothetical protein OG294_02750 [Kitasatospora sp. NBC_01302]
MIRISLGMIEAKTADRLAEIIRAGADALAAEDRAALADDRSPNPGQVEPAGVG